MSHRISNWSTVIVLICSSHVHQLLAASQHNSSTYCDGNHPGRRFVSHCLVVPLYAVLPGFDPVFRSPMVHVWHISQRIGIDDWAMCYWKKSHCKNLPGSPTLCWWYPPDMPQLHVRSMLIRFSPYFIFFFAKGILTCTSYGSKDAGTHNEGMRNSLSYVVWSSSPQLKKCSRPKCILFACRSMDLLCMVTWCDMP